MDFSRYHCQKIKKKLVKLNEHLPKHRRVLYKRCLQLKHLFSESLTYFPKVNWKIYYLYAHTNFKILTIREKWPSLLAIHWVIKSVKQTVEAGPKSNMQGTTSDLLRNLLKKDKNE